MRVSGQGAGDESVRVGEAPAQAIGRWSRFQIRPAHFVERVSEQGVRRQVVALVTFEPEGGEPVLFIGRERRMPCSPESGRIEALRSRVKTVAMSCYSTGSSARPRSRPSVSARMVANVAVR